MNKPPKNSTSVARNVHIPSVDASFCCSASSNCSAKAICVSAMDHLLLFFGRVLIRSSGDKRRFVEIVFRRRRIGLPFQASRIPGIGGSFFSVLERPKEVDERQHIT